MNLKKREEVTQTIGASYGIPNETNHLIRQSQMDDMKTFLSTAPNDWGNTAIKAYKLPNGEFISCVLWNNLFYISGTDIVRSLVFRFYAYGRPVVNIKKFEEGIFSDLRNLKPGYDSSLEEPRSELLDMLYKSNCVRTKKKQKVFYWFSVPHDRLFMDALERDIKREKMGSEPTTKAMARPALRRSISPGLKSPPHKLTPKNTTLKRSRIKSVPVQSHLNKFSKSSSSFGIISPDKQRPSDRPQLSPTRIRVRSHEHCHHSTPMSTNLSHVSSFGSPPKKSNDRHCQSRLAARKASLPSQTPWQSSYYSVKPEELIESVTHVDLLSCFVCNQSFSDLGILTEHQRLAHLQKDQSIMSFPSDNSWDLMDIDIQNSDSLFYLYNNHLNQNSNLNQNLNQNLLSQSQCIYDLSTTSSTDSLQYYEDDLSSSTISSPADAFTSSMTLFQSFKPVFQDDDQNQLDLSICAHANHFPLNSFGA